VKKTTCEKGGKRCGGEGDWTGQEKNRTKREGQQAPSTSQFIFNNEGGEKMGKKRAAGIKGIIQKREGKFKGAQEAHSEIKISAKTRSSLRKVTSKVVSPSLLFRKKKMGKKAGGGRFHTVNVSSGRHRREKKMGCKKLRFKKKEDVGGGGQTNPSKKVKEPRTAKTPYAPQVASTMDCSKPGVTFKEALLGSGTQTQRQKKEGQKKSFQRGKIGDTF